MLSILLIQLYLAAIPEARKMTKSCMAPDDLMTPSILEVPIWEILNLVLLVQVGFEFASKHGQPDPQSPQVAISAAAVLPDMILCPRRVIPLAQASMIVLSLGVPPMVLASLTLPACLEGLTTMTLQQLLA